MLLCCCDVLRHGAGYDMHVAEKNKGTAAIHWHLVTSSRRKSYDALQLSCLISRYPMGQVCFFVCIIRVGTRLCLSYFVDACSVPNPIKRAHLLDM